ncbi:MAG: hypothetical protein HPY74_20460 [Firmicutes bacterium]|nr:hypothetical protein [Bacillota bacterium]
MSSTITEEAAGPKSFENAGPHRPVKFAFQPPTLSNYTSKSLGTPLGYTVGYIIGLSGKIKKSPYNGSSIPCLLVVGAYRFNRSLTLSESICS